MMLSLTLDLMFLSKRAFIAPANRLEGREPMSASRAGLDPKFQKKLVLFEGKLAEHGIKVIMTWGYRSTADQNALYAKGRTAPGSVVTYAKGGYSWHNLGFAADYAFVIDGKVTWNGPWDIRCECCGHAMYPTWTKRRGKIYRYYVCVKASKSGYDSCDVKSVSAGQIEGPVIEPLRAIFRTPEMVAQTYMAARRLTDEEKMDTASDDIYILTEREVAESLNTLDPIWDELFPLERQKIVKLLVEQVTRTQRVASASHSRDPCQSADP